MLELQYSRDVSLLIMSDSYLRYVPNDPAFVPQAEAACEAVRFLGKLASAGTIETRISETVMFVDAGENWDGVCCPTCGADADAWWSTAMDAAWQSQFACLDVRAQCCGNQVSLNELRYGWPVAFGKFVLEVRNAGIPRLQPEQLARLESILGCGLKEILANT
ncbi:hypothetical protein NX784_08670 [Massilia pinisoli]|uniref:Uncharacterized protein n=1 Tax=Massilia pinisoli TaxID=1772194 RepID=A0ABT1ZP37_9BURK|nr:hypothetical protein [Massilia pinisoli]MCS0581664.1 hypothetical protein [Massilia pinisoli]